MYDSQILLQKYFYKYKRPKEENGETDSKDPNQNLKFAKLKMKNKILKSKTAKGENDFSSSDFS